jgi:hypothetical protein
MEKYYMKRPRTKLVDTVLPSSGSTTPRSVSSEYDRYHQGLVVIDDDEGWATELRRYLKERPANITKDTDIVQWWQVRPFMICHSSHLLIQL